MKNLYAELEAREKRTKRETPPEKTYPQCGKPLKDLQCPDMCGRYEWDAKTQTHEWAQRFFETGAFDKMIAEKRNIAI